MPINIANTFQSVLFCNIAIDLADKCTTFQIFYFSQWGRETVIQKDAFTASFYFYKKTVVNFT